ncbi:MAG: hypothetical protein F6K23_13520 [Okeania sp. SIO2C9]|uniref:hypothetical protein n=1 Tax=Okeania sp. SIO2C9 TaxID=2607791 RepID=UPI0013C09C17|nr:hypothetical protein [Okeania sp. SIO2C9]NEQ73970.1 hypothetical protein [Okeania sp. SIO2C9]
MTTSWPRNLDTLFGGAQRMCDRVADLLAFISFIRSEFIFLVKGMSFVDYFVRLSGMEFYRPDY